MSIFGILINLWITDHFASFYSSRNHTRVQVSKVIFLFWYFNIELGLEDQVIFPENVFINTRNRFNTSHKNPTCTYNASNQGRLEFDVWVQVGKLGTDIITNQFGHYTYFRSVLLIGHNPTLCICVSRAVRRLSNNHNRDQNSINYRL